MIGSYEAYLAVGAALFVIGSVGFLTRRNLILMMLSAELMLHGVSLTFVAFGRMHGRMEGQVFTIFLLTVAACEAGLSLSIILSLYQRAHSLDVEIWSSLKEADLPRSTLADEPTVEEEPDMVFPTLTSAGEMPSIDEDAPLEPQVGRTTRRKKAGSFRYGDPEDDRGDTP